MVNDDFAIFSADPVLVSIRDMSTRALLDELQQVVPGHLFDAPLHSYRLANLRYSIQQKLVIGLTSPQSIRPIALRVFPAEKLAARLASAQRIYPNNVFCLPKMCAIAWVFPAERKLSLGLVNDPSRLKRILAEKCDLAVSDIELMHFVPEHAYTARLDGHRSDGSPACEYLKIHYDDSGAATASRMRQLHAQLQDDAVRVPERVCYIEDEKLLLQSSLDRDPARSLTDSDAATTLARIHRLSVFGLDHDDGDLAGRRQATENLVSRIFPEHSDQLRRINSTIGRALEGSMPARQVVLHGDAHLGNLFPLSDGAIGVIDLDGMRWGSALDDLASYYGFLIWINLRDHLPIDHLFARFPAFIQAYNQSATHPVNETHAFAMLAQKLVAERIRRGITRGKMVDGRELAGLLSAASACLGEAGNRHVC